jgi:hypothetical protein
MVNNIAVRYFKEQKQDVSCDECFPHIALKALCFAGLSLQKKLQHTKQVNSL